MKYRRPVKEGTLFFFFFFFFLLDKVSNVRVSHERSQMYLCVTNNYWE